MPMVRYVFTLALALTTAMSAVQVLAGTSHEAHQGHAAALTLNNGAKWPTDEPLRQGMSTLRAAFADKLEAIHSDTLSAAEYQALGDTTTREVGRIVAQCKLTPEADAVLHVIIADMLAGADILTGKSEGTPREGAHRVVMALEQYGTYFDHPEWQGLE